MDITGVWRKQKVAYDTCRDCDVSFQNPMLTPDACRTFYSSGEYRRVVNHKPGVADSVIRGQERRAKAIMELLSPRLASVDRHLDIGSGAGILIREIGKHYGCQGVGVELDGDYVAFAAEQGVESGPDMPDGTFDLITIVHTLEHLARPMDMLRQINERLRGYLYVEVPTNEYDVVHPFVFNEKSLRAAIEMSGMTVLEMGKNARGDLWAWG